MNFSSEDWVIGDWKSSKGILIGIYMGDFFAYAGNERESGIKFSTPYDLNIHTVSLTNQNVIFDDEIKTNTDYNSIPNKDITLKIFKSNHYSTSSFSKRVYYLKMYNFDSVLVRDYIPVIDSSERPCLFDKVEKKCYYNQGTGEFLLE